MLKYIIIDFYSWAASLIRSMNPIGSSCLFQQLSQKKKNGKKNWINNSKQITKSKKKGSTNKLIKAKGERNQLN